MAKLAYKTRGNSNPQGKERVFFTCHPEDFDKYFEPICEDIFKTQNCAIWYDEEPDITWDPETMNTELGRMQLFVIPITTKFLYKENNAREVYFRFAMEHHIPVLPLMQESGLEPEFNRICGDLQFLDKNAAMTDSTALPYEQKLERFLSSVLLGDDLAEKVRKAFDAYIFLSYRKKDRKYAQELMRLIHQNDFCRDIAIWYDEFLVPGEDFNHAIQDAMEKSELFTFVVTPNLLEQGNYVMTTEYPVAKETGKQILPVEMAPTDREALRKNFAKIPEPTDAHDAPALSGALSAGLMDQVKKLAIAENDDDPEHLFFIGLAYLSGIDVEENRDRGVQLITAAAEGDVPEAMEKLSQMYKNGEGVERDYEISAKWLEKLANYWERRFAENGTIEAGNLCLSVLCNLGDLWYVMGRLNSAEQAYQRMHDLSIQILKQNKEIYYISKVNISYERLGNICEKRGNLSEARVMYEKSLKLDEVLIRASNAEESQRNLSIGYSRLGRISELEGKLNEARIWYEKSLKIDDILTQTTNTEESQKVRSITYDNLGRIYKAEGNITKAYKCYKKSLEIRESLNMKTGTENSQEDLCVCYDQLGRICEMEGNLNEARIWYEKSLRTREQLNKEMGTQESKQCLCISYSNLGRISEMNESLDEAKIWYEKDLEISEILSRETDTVESQRNLGISYYQLGELNEAEGKLDKAKALHEKSLNIREALCKKTKTTESQRDLSASYYKLGEINEKECNIRQAKIWYNKSLVICESIYLETRTLQSRRDLLFVYGKLGEINVKEGNLSEAKILYEKNIVLSEEINQDAGTIDSQHNLSLCYVKMGEINEAEKNLSDAKCWYKKGLAISEELNQVTGTIKSKRFLYPIYNKLGAICKEEGSLNDAKMWYKKALEVSEELSEVEGTVESYNNLAASYYILGRFDMDKPDIKLLRKATSIWLKLSEQCPEIPMFKQFLEHTNDVIKKAKEQQMSE